MINQNSTSWLSDHYKTFDVAETLSNMWLAFGSEQKIREQSI